MELSPSIRIGLIGNGLQMRAHHLPYLEARAREVEISWLGGCQCSEREQVQCRARCHRPGKLCNGSSSDWMDLLEKHPVDAVLISTPNALHAAAAEACLMRKICVAVDKPSTIRADCARSLVELAEAHGLVFATLAQRRFERLYREVDAAFASLGQVRLINYVIAHGMVDYATYQWRTRASLSGGGVLLDSAYHGIDVLLWMLARSDGSIGATDVSALMDCSGMYGSEVEDSATATVRLSSGGLLNISASYLGPRASLDESFLIYGTEGAVRIQRHRMANTDQSAAALAIQSRDGTARTYDTSTWSGDRTAPLRDFIDAVFKWRRGTAWTLACPASDSVRVLGVIDAAYASARFGGLPMPVGSVTANGIDHVALQTNDLDLSLHFYVDVLGGRLLCRKRFKRREMAWIEVGMTRLEVFSKRSGDTLQP